MYVFYANASPGRGVSKHFGAVCDPYVPVCVECANCMCPGGVLGVVRRVTYLTLPDVRARTESDLERGVGWNS